ncbi:MAG: flavodoxin family protein [Synergistaceae bacterium]|nr:flavodoxin family protein [Synergistaceae bacterium]
MSKKILVLTSSPRKNSNTTKMARAFAQSAETAGNEVIWFDAAKRKINGCDACDGCWSNGRACVQNDDFNELAALLESCDVLLIATPLYWLGFPAQVKAAIDKLYAYGGEGGLRPLAVKESYLFVCGGDVDKEEYKPILQTYETSAEFLGWKNRGVIQIGGVDAEGALEASCVLERASELGKAV